MKIAFLVNTKSIHSEKWVEYFKKNSEVYVLEPRECKFKLIGLIADIFLFYLKIKKIKPDILHAHYAGVNGVIGAMSGFHPFVLTAWGSDILINSKKKAIKPLLRFVLNSADLITCDAEHMKKELVALGAKEYKIKIINFGVDTDTFSPKIHDAELKRNLGAYGCDVVISLRNLKKIYNLETLIRAIPIVLKEAPQTKFIIGGSGDEEEMIKKMANNLGVIKNVIFIGHIENSFLPKYLNLADIYVSTSLSDAGISASTAEAMACELAPVVSDSGENRLWIKNGYSGFVVPVKNPEMLAEKIIYLLKNKETRKLFGENARKVIIEKNSYTGEMAKMGELYKKLLRA